MFEVAWLVERLAREHESPVILFDNVELLFAPALQLDPLRLLQQTARNRTVVAAWNGRVDDGSLTYAEPSHPEYRRYATDEILLVGPGF